jgi:oxygen-independent coproporphyrinogen III oxidase
MIETSPKSRPGTPPPPLQKETAVGNYFVSNYPPFSFWRPEQVPDLEAVMERPPSPNTPLGLYVHIPFCRKRCHFCYFKVYTDKDSAAIRGYLETLLAELRIYAAKPFIGGRRPQFVYFGGGTPSYLSADQLRTLVQGMRECLPWDQVEEVTFECEPGTLTDHKLEVIRELGVTRLSLGVENFDDHILEVNGRAHHSREIERAYGFARQVGFPQINVDLIAGMLEETEENWRQCIRRTLEMAPDSVTIYEMEIPYNTTIYQRMKAEGKLAAPVADWETKRRWVHEAFNELERAGYSIASAYTAVRDRASTRFLYRDRLWAGADLLSLGVASFGHLGGTHYQNHHDFDPYVQALQTGRLPIYRALTPSADERLIREFILQLKLGRLGFDYFRQKFGVDPATRFAEPLDRLARWGYLEADASEVRVSRDGLLQIDRLLHEFFLPEHRNARYA